MTYTSATEFVIERHNISALPFSDIVVARRADGRHMRLSNGRRMRAVGRYSSVKNGASVPWESRVELLALHGAEVDVDVVSYAVQPETWSWRSAGLRRTYTPDRLDRLADGCLRVSEVKDTFDKSADPAYSQKIDEAAAIYIALGRRFQLQVKADLLAEPYYAAVDEVQTYRRSAVTVQDIWRVQHVLRAAPRPFSDVKGALDHPRAHCILYAMMVRRIIAIELRDGLSDQARVDLIGEGR